MRAKFAPDFEIGDENGWWLYLERHWRQIRRVIPEEHADMAKAYLKDRNPALATILLKAWMGREGYEDKHVAYLLGMQEVIR